MSTQSPLPQNDPMLIAFQKLKKTPEYQDAGISKRRQMDIKTIIAVGELVQAAAHQNGVTGPVEFTVLGRSGSHWCGGDDDDIEMDEYDCPFCGEWNRCECFDDDDLDDRLTDDLYDQL